MVIEHVFRDRGGSRRGDVSARALVKAGLYERAEKEFVDTSRLLREAGVTGASPPSRRT